MGTDYKIKKPKDITRINSGDMEELLWWTQQLGTNPERILAVIEEVGNLTDEVKKKLK